MDAPKQDWNAYAAMTAASDAAWIRGLTVSDKFALYQEMFRLMWSAPRDPAERERLERWRWEQKLETRLRMVEAFRKLDQLQHARSAAEDPR